MPTYMMSMKARADPRTVFFLQSEHVRKCKSKLGLKIHKEKAVTGRRVWLIPGGDLVVILLLRVVIAITGSAICKLRPQDACEIFGRGVFVSKNQNIEKLDMSDVLIWYFSFI